MDGSGMGRAGSGSSVAPPRSGGGEWLPGGAGVGHLPDEGSKSPEGHGAGQDTSGLLGGRVPNRDSGP